MPVRFPEPAGALILELRHHLGGGAALGRFLRVRVGGRPVDQSQPPITATYGSNPNALVPSGAVAGADESE